MDEFNLSSRFAQDDEEDQRPNRRKKKPRFRTGVGMEKPAEEDILDDIGGIETEPGEKSPAEMPPMDELGEEEPEEDEAFDALVSPPVPVVPGSAGSQRSPATTVCALSSQIA